MADMKIEDATLDASVGGGELIPVSDEGTAKCMSVSQVKDYVLAQITGEGASTTSVNTAADKVYLLKSGEVKYISAQTLAAAVMDYAFALSAIVSINGNEKIAVKDNDVKKITTLSDLKEWVLGDLSSTSGFVTTSGAERIAALETAVSDKVDKVAYKGLSTNDYTTAEKDKLAGLVSNMQADWEQTDNTKGDFIKNKPSVSFASEIWPEWDEDDANDYVVGYRVTHESKFYEALVSMVGDTTAQPVTNSLYWKQITVGETIEALEEGKVDVEAGKGLSTEDYTTAEKTKLSGIETGAEVNTIREIVLDENTLNPDVDGAVDISTARNMKVVYNMQDVPNDGGEGHPQGEMLFAHLATGLGTYLDDVWINYGDEESCAFRHVDVTIVDPDTYYHPEQQNG